MAVGQLSWVQRTMQKDFQQSSLAVDVMCEACREGVRRGIVYMAYYDEQTWHDVDPALVEQGEPADIVRFKNMGVHEYASLG